MYQQRHETFHFHIRLLDTNKVHKTKSINTPIERTSAHKKGTKMKTWDKDDVENNIWELDVYGWDEIV